MKRLILIHDLNSQNGEKTGIIFDELLKICKGYSIILKQTGKILETEEQNADGGFSLICFSSRQELQGI